MNYSPQKTQSRPAAQRGPATAGQQLQPLEDLRDYAIAYARQKPEAAAMWCFGVGFLLGWKLKPW